MPTTWQLVAGDVHGGMGGAGVQHGSFCSAVESSTATAVVHVGSTVQGGTQATTRHTMRPMHATFWLHCPYRNCRHPVRYESQPLEPHPQFVPSHSVPQNGYPSPHPLSHEQVALQSM